MQSSIRHLRQRQRQAVLRAVEAKVRRPVQAKKTRPVQLGPGAAVPGSPQLLVEGWQKPAMQMDLLPAAESRSTEPEVMRRVPVSRTAKQVETCSWMQGYHSWV